MMENFFNVFKNYIKDIHNELDCISCTFEELVVRVQKNREEYVHQLEIINTGIQKAMKKQANSMSSKPLGGQGGEKIILNAKPIISNSVKEPLINIKDPKTQGGQVPQGPITTNSVKGVFGFGQLSLRKLTLEELFKYFCIVLPKDSRPINYLVFVTFSLYWLCGAHQKNILAFWLFMLQYFYNKKNLLTELNINSVTT